MGSSRSVCPYHVQARNVHLSPEARRLALRPAASPGRSTTAALLLALLASTAPSRALARARRDRPAVSALASPGGSGSPPFRRSPRRRLPEPPAPGEPVRVAVLSQGPAPKEQVEARLRPIDGVALVDPETGRPHVRVLAVSSPKEAVALVDGLDAERDCHHPVERVPDTHPRAVLMGVGGRPGPEEAGLYGCLGFLTLDVPTDRQLAGLRNVAAGTHDAPDPFGPLFHQGLWRGSLTPQGRRLLHLAADGATHQEMMAALHLGEETLDRWVRDVRARLDLKRSDRLWLAAHRRGFGD